MELEIAAFYHRAFVFLCGVWESAKSLARSFLGPEPERLYVFTDGRVAPVRFDLPEALQSTTYVFDPATNRITLASAPEPEGRFRRLPLIGLRLEHPSIEPVDLSDWIGDIRANPVPSLTTKQLIQIGSYTQQRYLPTGDGAIAHVVGEDGETTQDTLI